MGKVGNRKAEIVRLRRAGFQKGCPPLLAPRSVQFHRPQIVVNVGDIPKRFRRCLVKGAGHRSHQLFVGVLRVGGAHGGCLRGKVSLGQFRKFHPRAENIRVPLDPSIPVLHQSAVNRSIEPARIKDVRLDFFVSVYVLVRGILGSEEVIAQTRADGGHAALGLKGMDADVFRDRRLIALLEVLSFGRVRLGCKHGIG